MTKKEKFIEIIKHQLNIELENDKDNMFNKNRNLLYTKIERKNKISMFKYLVEHNICYNSHLKDYYWIYL